MEQDPYRPAANRGFTLIEIVLTIVILGAVAGIMVPFLNAIVHSPDPVIRERAISLGQGMMDEIMAKRWDEKTPLGGGPICSGESSDKGTRHSLVDNCANPGALTASAIGEDPGEESKRTDYDDVDDYNGITETNSFKDQNDKTFNLPGYTRTIAVEYIPSSSDPITENLPATGSLVNPTDTKRVVVTITSPLGEKFYFVAVACNI